MLAVLLKKVVDSPTMSILTALGVSTVIILSAINLGYEIRIKKIQLKNLQNK
jgi:hypothetical protein